MSAHVQAQLAAFSKVARPLEYQPNAGGATTPFRGVLRDPRPEELVGGLPVSARVVVARASVFTKPGIKPTTFDYILDPNEPGRKYSIALDPTWLYAGSSRVWWKAMVNG